MHCHHDDHGVGGGRHDRIRDTIFMEAQDASFDPMKEMPDLLSPAPNLVRQTFITVKSKKLRLRKRRTCVHTYITSKQIELEGPGCTGFEENSKCFKT